jgi:hypothetical protein
MAWLLLAVIVGSAAFAGFRVWQRWIEPWREVDELLSALAAAARRGSFS